MKIKTISVDSSNAKGQCYLKYISRPWVTEGLELDIDCESSGMSAQQIVDPLEYDLAIIDASDDLIRNPYYLSKVWRNRNPNLIIIGTSMAKGYFTRDEVAGLYDETMELGRDLDLKTYSSKMLEILRRRFPHAMEAKTK